MSKTNELSMNQNAVRARKRRGKERKEQCYNTVLKEFIQCKYGHIIGEFQPFYHSLKLKYPKRRFYANTNEFRLWRKRQIEIYGERSSTGSEQEQSEQQQYDEQQEQSEQQQYDEQQEQSEQQQYDEQQEQTEHHQYDEQQEQIEQDNILEQVDNEINDIINELENDGVPLDINDDEGIHLDIYEELQADITDFDYRLEVELEGW